MKYRHHRHHRGQWTISKPPLPVHRHFTASVSSPIRPAPSDASRCSNSLSCLPHRPSPKGG
ncbi:hypothetical protein LZ30DRAFT_723957 [Colletotrichum cereale]|nr:hypothetical protein LZ30DRAFT_723957 [Colletotrichum cereale]